eukprot:1156987-Pelagomonas_calceolata.AAC.2
MKICSARLGRSGRGLGACYTPETARGAPHVLAIFLHVFYPCVQNEGGCQKDPGRVRRKGSAHRAI